MPAGGGLAPIGEFPGAPGAGVAGAGTTGTGAEAPPVGAAPVEAGEPEGIFEGGGVGTRVMV